MDKLASMAMFLRIVDSGSFRAAAEAAGISPTMAGKHLRLLEQHLGARLLHRTTRQRRLTAIGRLYYERCQQALAAVALADASASELQATPRGRLRITAPLSFGSYRLTPALTDYLHHYPLVQIELTLDNRPFQLIDEGYDLAIRIGPIHDHALVARPLAAYRMLLAASPAYLDCHGRPQHPRALTEHACLHLSQWRKQNHWQLQGPEGELCDIAIHGSLSVNHGEALRNAARQGAGIILQPHVLLADDLAHGLLEEVLPGWAPPATPMHLLYAPERRPSATLRSIIDFLVARFAPSTAE